jgi:hypothetical protein
MGQLVHRYALDRKLGYEDWELYTRWGRCNLNPVDPYSLKAPGFNP